MSQTAAPAGDSGRRNPLALLRALERLIPSSLLTTVRDLVTRSGPIPREVDAFGKELGIEEELGPLLDFFYERYFRVKVEGIENVPDRGPVVLVSNHGGVFPWDSVLLSQAVRREHAASREVRPLIEDDYFHFPYLGTFLNRLGAVRACPENARRLLAEGQIVASFPEGFKGATKLFRERNRLQRFGRGGVVRLSLDTEAPIIPVAMVGPDETHPVLARLPGARRPRLPFMVVTPTFPLLGPLGLMPLPVRWTIRFGPPLDLSPRAEDADSLRVRVSRLNEELRQTIQAMLSDLAEARGGVFRS